MTKLSIYIILFSDLDFLNDIISLIYDNIDEIIIVDGPYSYNIHELKNYELYYDENTKPSQLINILNKYSNKIKYYYKLWDTEKEKRCFGYDKCTNNNILLVDCDEFFILDINKINQFINSNKSVCNMDIYNMNRININYDKVVQKSVLFKKTHITSEQHLSYLWLVGVNNLAPKDQNNIYNGTVGVIYHQTLNRNKYNNIIKFIFYITLYHKNNNNNISILNHDISNLKLTLSNDTLLNIFYHSKIELIGMPSNNILYYIDVPINLDKYNTNHMDGYFANNSFALLNTPYYCYICKESISNISCYFDNVKIITCHLYEINLNEPYHIYEHNKINIENNMCTLNFNIQLKPNHINYIMMFNCSETIDKSSIILIKDII